MFKSHEAYYVLRAVVAAFIAASGAILAATTDNSISLHEWALIVVAFVGGLAAWLGIGYATPMEPFVGVKAKRVKVPAPPAQPVPPTK